MGGLLTAMFGMGGGGFSQGALLEYQRRREEDIANMKAGYEAQRAELKAQHQQTEEQNNKRFNEFKEMNQQQLDMLRKHNEEEMEKTKAKMDEAVEMHQKQMESMKLEQLKSTYRVNLSKLELLMQAYATAESQVNAALAEYDGMFTQMKREELKMRTKFAFERDNPDVVRLLVYGPTGCGKSTIVNRFSGDRSDMGDKGSCEVGHGIDSMTKDIDKISIESKIRFGANISVTDCPGANDTDYQDRDHANQLVEYLRGIKYFHAVLLMFGAQNPRITDKHIKMFRDLEKHLGEHIWENVILVPTGEYKLKEQHGKAQEQRRQLKQKMSELTKRFDIDWQIVMINNYDLPDCETRLKKIVTIAQKLGRCDCVNLCSPLEELKSDMTGHKLIIEKRLNERNEKLAVLKAVFEDNQNCIAQIKKKEPDFFAPNEMEPPVVTSMKEISDLEMYEAALETKVRAKVEQEMEEEKKKRQQEKKFGSKASGARERYEDDHKAEFDREDDRETRRAPSFGFRESPSPPAPRHEIVNEWDQYMFGGAPKPKPKREEETVYRTSGVEVEDTLDTKKSSFSSATPRGKASRGTSGGHPPYLDWTADEVGMWVRYQLGLGEDIGRIFREEEIQGEDLMNLTNENLKDMGLKMGPRKRILDGVEKLQTSF